MSESKSYRQILRSSSIIGGASVINIVLGLLRMKVAAVVLGPAGVGLIGLLQSLMTTASAVSAMGLGNAGTRQIAEAVTQGNSEFQGLVRRALFWVTLLLAVAGGLAFWALRDVLALQLLGDPAASNDLGWLAFGVALTVAAGSQGALLNGMRRVADMARVSVVAGLLSAASGIVALWGWGASGVVAFMLAAPLASFVVGHWYVAKLPPSQGAPAPVRMVVRQWMPLLRLGAAFLVSGLVVALGNLAVRALVQRELGSDANGYFQAAWMISMTYIGFVLGAMGADFFPRLTGTMHDTAVVNRLVNQQTEVALILAGPALVATIGLAPWILELLYSEKFVAAAWTLRWQVLGDVLKVASWPLGYLILAAGDGRTFMTTESLATVIFVGVTMFGIPVFGVQATGIAFVAMYLLLLPVVYWLAARRTGFRWTREVSIYLGVLLTLSLIVFFAAYSSNLLSAGIGLLSSVMLGVYGLARLGQLADFGGPLGRAAKLSQKTLAAMGVWRD